MLISDWRLQVPWRLKPGTYHLFQLPTLDWRSPIEKSFQVLEVLHLAPDIKDRGSCYSGCFM
ncbi:MAG: hypothetical protein DMG06_31175 [Acidobacteria bacterium]|nr:MAG: hypothetical protein DMG06_31175 [Acidobacteriota bacterium]